MTNHSRTRYPQFPCSALIRLLVSAALFLLAGAGAWATTYYIDYNAVDDTANGTSEATPWKHQPFMQGFGHAYAHSAGDTFVFKGGVTWPSTCFVMSIPTGGSAAAFDTYTTDPAWYAGSGFSAPVWDGGYAALSGSQNMVQMSNVSYVVFNGLEVRHFKATANFGQGMFSMYACNGIHWTNDYLHGWSLDSSVGTDDAHGAIIHVVAGGLSMSDMVIDRCTIENSEQTGVRQNGLAVRQVNTIRNSVLHDVSSAVLFAGDFHNNTVYNVAYPAGNASFDPTYHTNVLYLSLWNGNAPITTPATVYDNVYHDIGAGTPPIYFCPGEISPYNQTLYAYNNLIYGSAANLMAVEIDPAGTSGNTGTAYIYNNTLVFPNATGEAVLCVNRGGSPQVANVVAQNNQLIGGSLTVLSGPCATSTTDHNLMQSTAVTTAQGYVLATLFAPTLSAGATVDAGVSESSVFATDQLGASRPQGLAWDIGAYEFSGTGSIPPKAPTGLHVVP